MLLGLLVAGAGVGAVVALVWFLSGGTLLGAIALYSLVATAVVLGCAVIAFVVSERRGHEVSGKDKALRPAE